MLGSRMHVRTYICTYAWLVCSYVYICMLGWCVHVRAHMYISLVGVLAHVCTYVCWAGVCMYVQH